MHYKSIFPTHNKNDNKIQIIAKIKKQNMLFMTYFAFKNTTIIKKIYFKITKL